MKKTNLIVESLYGKYDRNGNLPVKEHLISDYDYDEYTDDVLDAYDRGEITAEEKHAEYERLGRMLDEAYADVWWQYTWEERPEDLEKYGLKFKPLAKKPGMTLYRFLGSQDAIDQAKKDGYLDSKAGFIDESLTEARNPENDEINNLILKASRTGRVSKKTEQILQQHGITVDHKRHVLVGPNGRALRLDYTPGTPTPQIDDDWSGWGKSTSEKHYMDTPERRDNFDYLNYLSVDREFEDKGRNFYQHTKIPNPGADTTVEHVRDTSYGHDLGWKDMRSPESQSLRPYSDEYKARNLERQQAKKEAEAAKQGFKRKDAELKKFVSDIKSRKNESLSLKESADTAFPTFEAAFKMALKDAVWHDITEAEAEEIVRKITLPVSRVVNDIFEMIKMLDERISELENK